MKLSSLTWKPKPHVFSEQALVEFPNGYGASILRGGAPYTYTQDGTYELAILHRGDLCYDSCLATDVMARLSSSEVETVLTQISELAQRAH